MADWLPKLTPVARIYTQGRYTRASVKPGPGQALVLLDDAERALATLQVAAQARARVRTIPTGWTAREAEPIGGFPAVELISPDGSMATFGMFRGERVARDFVLALLASAKPPEEEGACDTPDLRFVTWAANEGYNVERSRHDGRFMDRRVRDLAEAFAAGEQAAARRSGA